MNAKSSSAPPLDPVEEAIFNAASELADAPARAAFLDRACAQDAALRSRLEILLRAEQQAARFFAADPLQLAHRPGPQADAANAAPVELPASPALPLGEAPGGRIGRYKLLQKIGEGGMGVVYMAEQQEPVRRRVALKVIKLGMDTRSVVARFEAERQALALMDHPNIARIFDGGVTETGRPYFVMELIQGMAITDYCDRNRLPLPARLQLFVKVCEAVQSAHQKGIIHRDLKPSNVMVTLHDGVPVPKVIDFGVAKATNQELTAKTLFTRHATLIGTPAYMSPEQAELSGLDIDTRSDLYSLGVLLYELLTGTTPFPEQRLRSVGYGEMQRIIVQEEPERPSTKLGRTLRLGVPPSSGPGPAKAGTPNRDARPAEAGTPNARPPSRAQLQEQKARIDQLKGDLDSIVLKCLEKDRTRRYDTANGLAADLRRHLNHEPVVARPPSARYQFQKFVRRHRAAATVTVFILLGVLTAFSLGTISYRRERAARAAAEQARVAEAAQRQRAQAEATRAGTEADRARRFQYASDMNLAQQAVADGDLFRALQLLDRHRPGSSRGDEAQTSARGTDQSLLTSAATEDLRGWEWRYLWKQCEGGQLAILGSHSNAVTAVGFLPDGKTAFSAGKDGLLRLWDMRSRKQAGALNHGAGLAGAACSPDGRWLATSAFNRIEEPLLLWDLATRQSTPVTTPTNAWVRPNTLVFSPDSRLLAYAVYGLGVFVWDLAARTNVAFLPPASSGYMHPWGVAFSPDGNTLAYAEDVGGDIVLRNLRERTVERRLKGHSWYVSGLLFTPDGRHLLSSSGDRTVKFWDLPSGQEKNTFTYPLGFGRLLSSPSLSRDGTMLATAVGGGGGKITVQEMPGGREIVQLRGHQNRVTDTAFSPDGRTLLSGSFDGTVRLWELKPAAKESGFRKFPDLAPSPGLNNSDHSLAPDGQHLLTVFTNGTFTVWEIPGLRESPRHPLPVRNLATVALATGGQLAAFVADDGNVVFWRAGTGETNGFGRPVRDRVTRSAFSLDGRHFAVAGAQELAVCDVATGATRIFQTGVGAPMALAFSDDGQKLMAGYWDGLVKVQRLPEPSSQLTLRGHDHQVNGTVLLPDGETLVSASTEIRFWDLKTSATRLKLQPRAVSYRVPVLSADGRRLAVGDGDGVITIWDLASQQEVATLSGHTRPITSLRFLPDGVTLVSVAVDQVRVWRAASLEEADAGRGAR